MRVALNNINRNYFKRMQKISSSVLQKPQSNTLVQAGYFRKGGIYYLFNLMKNSNTNLELKRNISHFTPSSYQKELLLKYQQLCLNLQKRNLQQLNKCLSDTLFKEYKDKLKNKQKKAKVDLSNWKLIEDANAAKIVQSRTYQQKISTFTSSDRWFQLTCQFTNSKGQQVYNTLEKHQKNESFKFIKFNI